MMFAINRQLSDYYFHLNTSRDQFDLGGGGGVGIVIPRIEGQLASEILGIVQP